MKEISVIIPFCDAYNGKAMKEREETLIFALENFYGCNKNIEVILVYQNYFPKKNISQKTLELLKRGVIVRQAYIKYPVFNKGWCINVGARLAESDVICIAESDMFVYGQYYFEDVLTGMAKIQWCFGWGSLWYTTMDDRIRIINGERVKLKSRVLVTPKRGLSEGGLVFFRKKFFLSIGGCNEWFQELGGPDNELARRAEAASGTYSNYPQEVIHLWHPKCRKKLAETRLRNVALYKSTVRHTKQFNEFLSSQQFGDTRAPLCSGKSFRQAWVDWSAINGSF